MKKILLCLLAVFLFSTIFLSFNEIAYAEDVSVNRDDDTVTTPVTPPDAAPSATGQPNNTTGGTTIDSQLHAPLPSTLPKLGLENETSPVSVVEKVLLNYVITPIFFLAGGVAIVVILYSSFRLISAHGEEEGVTAAKNSLIWALAGLGLVILSYTIVSNLARIIIGNL